MAVAVHHKLVYALDLRNQDAHQLLVLELTFLGHPDDQIVGVDGLLQLAPQVIPILPKGLDFGQPLLLSLPQLLHLFIQPGDLQVTLL